MQCRAQFRRGLTLTELLVATTIMTIIAGAMATLAVTVHTANDHSRGQLVSAQHARVALDRIEQALAQAVASEQFPGCLVISEQAGAQELPHTLVVWSPTGAPANPAGMPLVRELVLFGPDPTQPRKLLEIRSPNDSSPVPSANDLSAWRTLTETLKTSQATDKLILTERLRTAPLSGNWTKSLTAADLRGVIRFRRLMAPSAEEWAEYRASTLPWTDIAWPLDSYRATSGTRQVVCQTELQLVAGDMAAAASTAIPFFGSASISYELTR